MVSVGGSTFDSNTIVKFADVTAVVSVITDNNEKAYLKEEEGPLCVRTVFVLLTTEISFPILATILFMCFVHENLLAKIISRSLVSLTLSIYAKT